MVDSTQSTQNNQSSYWTSVAVAGMLFAIISFALSLITNYIIISSEPTGSYFSPSSLLGCFACLIGGFGGMVATWHYAKEYDVVIKLGKGALIGFLTGICIVLVTIVLNQIWQLVDPDMTQQVVDSMVANFEAMDMPSSQVDAMVESTRNQYTISSQLLWGIPIFGILNLLTGMIGAKVFGKNEDVL